MPNEIPVSMSPIGKIKQLYGRATILVCNLLLTVFALNLVSYFILQRTVKPNEEIPYFLSTVWRVWDAYQNKRDLIRAIYTGHPDGEIDQLLDTPIPHSHPVLEFMTTPVASRYYNVGVEGVRYSRSITPQNVVSSLNGSTWVLGSTTFGSGVADNETIPSFLGDRDAKSKYLNFGVRSGHQNLEINKLVLLLKKGYRPKRVIFIDGAPDFYANFVTDFHVAETPAIFSLAYRYDFNPETLPSDDEHHEKTVSLLDSIRSMPLSRLIARSRRNRVKNTQVTDSIPQAAWGEDIYDSHSDYAKSPDRHFQAARARLYSHDIQPIADKNLDMFVTKLESYYMLNSQFLEALSRAFGFEYYVFIQPFPELNLKNLFIKDVEAYKKTDRYRYLAYTTEKILPEIRGGRFPHFYDLSSADENCRNCYVDLEQYQPKLADMIAQKILSIIK